MTAVIPRRRRRARAALLQVDGVRMIPDPSTLTVSAGTLEATWTIPAENTESAHKIASSIRAALNTHSDVAGTVRPLAAAGDRFRLLGIRRSTFTWLLAEPPPELILTLEIGVQPLTHDSNPEV